MTADEAAALVIGQRIQFSNGQMVLVIANNAVAETITIQTGEPAGTNRLPGASNPPVYPTQVFAYDALGLASVGRSFSGGPQIDAPIDGQAWSRRADNRSWEPGGGPGGPGIELDPNAVWRGGTIAQRTMTGLLTLSGAPVNDTHAATKLYVDERCLPPGGQPGNVLSKQSPTDFDAVWIPPTVTNAPVLVGTINGLTGACQFTLESGLTNGPLPAAAPANRGFYVVCTVAGTVPGAPIAGMALVVGDWVISDGAAWILLAVGAASSPELDPNAVWRAGTTAQRTMTDPLTINTTVSGANRALIITSPLSPALVIQSQANGGNLTFEELGLPSWRVNATGAGFWINHTPAAGGAEAPALVIDDTGNTNGHVFITDAGNPVNPNDLARKAYVDAPADGANYARRGAVWVRATLPPQFMFITRITLPGNEPIDAATPSIIITIPPTELPTVPVSWIIGGGLGAAISSNQGLTLPIAGVPTAGSYGTFVEQGFNSGNWFGVNTAPPFSQLNGITFETVIRTSISTVTAGRIFHYDPAVDTGGIRVGVGMISGTNPGYTALDVMFGVEGQIIQFE
jgi:hypothetical protein